MNSRILPVIAFLLCLTACSPGATADPLKPPISHLANIQFPKEQAIPAFDLLTLDPRSGHLYVAHSSAGALEVVDVHSRSIVGHVTGLVGIKGIAITGDPNIVFTSQSVGTVAVVDVKALKVVKTVSLGGSPDAIDYDPVHDVVLVGLPGDKKLGVIDAKTQAVAGTIALPAAPELMAVDQKTGTVYLAIHDLSQVVVIDVPNRAVTKTYKGCDIDKPTGLAYDPEQGLLFVASNKQLNVIDVLIEQCKGAIDIGSGTDQIAFNSHTHHVYAANGGSRNVSVIDTVSLRPLGVAGTGPRAATIAVDPTTDNIYVMVTPAGIVSIYHDP